jgi:hypothetical protein
LIRVNREHDSKETNLSDLHAAKHFEQKIWTLRGIKMEGSVHHENAENLIRVHRESDLQKTDISDRCLVISIAYSVELIKKDEDEEELETDFCLKHCPIGLGKRWLGRNGGGKGRSKIFRKLLKIFI